MIVMGLGIRLRHGLMDFMNLKKKSKFKLKGSDQRFYTALECPVCSGPYWWGCSLDHVVKPLSLKQIKSRVVK